MSDKDDLAALFCYIHGFHFPILTPYSCSNARYVLSILACPGTQLTDDGDLLVSMQPEPGTSALNALHVGMFLSEICSERGPIEVAYVAYLKYALEMLSSLPGDTKLGDVLVADLRQVACVYYIRELINLPVEPGTSFMKPFKDGIVWMHSMLDTCGFDYANNQYIKFVSPACSVCSAAVVAIPTKRPVCCHAMQMEFSTPYLILSDYSKAPCLAALKQQLKKATKLFDDGYRFL